MKLRGMAAEFIEINEKCCSGKLIRVLRSKKKKKSKIKFEYWQKLSFYVIRDFENKLIIFRYDNEFGDIKNWNNFDNLSFRIDNL